MGIVVDTEANYAEMKCPSPPWWINDQEMMLFTLPLPENAIGAWVNGTYYLKPQAKSRYRGFFLKVGTLSQSGEYERTDQYL